MNLLISFKKLVLTAALSFLLCGCTMDEATRNTTMDQWTAYYGPVVDETVVQDCLKRATTYQNWWHRDNYAFHNPLRGLYVLECSYKGDVMSIVMDKTGTNFWSPKDLCPDCGWISNGTFADWLAQNHWDLIDGNQVPAWYYTGIHEVMILGVNSNSLNLQYYFGEKK